MAYAFTACSLPALSILWHDTVFFSHTSTFFIYIHRLIIAQEYQVARATGCLFDLYANLDCIWLLLLHGDDPSHYLRDQLWL